MFKALRDIKTFVDSNNNMSHGYIKKDDIVILLDQNETYSEYYESTFIRYRFLKGDTIHTLNGRKQKESEEISLDDAWHDKFFIKDFENEEKYLWTNTFIKVD